MDSWAMLQNSAPIFRSPTRVSLLSWFPGKTMCAVPTMHFALYTQSEYIPTTPVHPEEALYTHNAIGFVLNVFTARVQWRVYCFFIHKKIMVENVIYITSEYEERLRRCQYVPKLSFGRRMLKDDGAPNRFFLMYLFCNEFCT
jgi:hypothetical protein